MRLLSLCIVASTFVFWTEWFAGVYRRYGSVDIGERAITTEYNSVIRVAFKRKEVARPVSLAYSSRAVGLEFWAELNIDLALI